MSPISGYLTPEARATLDAVFAKLAAPGCATPPTPSRASAAPRRRPPSRATPAAPDNATTTRCSRWPARRWPPENSVSTTGCPPASWSPPPCKNSRPAPGKALTGGGTLLPMSDVIRLAGHAHHYLAIFDKGKALALYHTKRLASPAQRIVLYAKDRGCTFPGCHRARQPLRSPPRTLTPPTPSPTSTTSAWPAAPTTNSPNKAGPPAKTTRRHRMDPATAPRPRPTPDQHLPPPRKTPARRRIPLAGRADGIQHQVGDSVRLVEL